MTRRAGSTKSRTLNNRRANLSISVTGGSDALNSDIIAAAERALSSQRFRRGKLEIALVGVARMCQEHARWMNDASPTDVLTFDLRDKTTGRDVDGALIVCRSVAKQRARERKTDWEKELLLYIVHGCLHLCGYDDRDETDSARMHKEEDKILTSLGWGAVFAEQTARRGTQVKRKKQRRKTSR